MSRQQFTCTPNICIQQATRDNRKGLHSKVLPLGPNESYRYPLIKVAVQLRIHGIIDDDDREAVSRVEADSPDKAVDHRVVGQV